jgi:hypothetical protein
VEDGRNRFQKLFSLPGYCLPSSPPPGGFAVSFSGYGTQSGPEQVARRGSVLSAAPLA